MEIYCAICNKLVDEVLMEQNLFSDETTIHVKCHGDTDTCAFDTSLWIRDPNAKITKIEAFTTKRLNEPQKQLTKD